MVSMLAQAGFSLFAGPQTMLQTDYYKACRLAFVDAYIYMHFNATWLSPYPGKVKSTLT